ncbi:leucine-rich repeat protein [Gammaproteobacteria bacterium]|nr:leucine-rich repeat protein [Gammaproteobacteria bacterium]
MRVTYSADGVTATFTGTGEFTESTVYNYLDGATVAIIVGYSSIDPWAFYNASALTSITIPEGVTSIGDYAFYMASALTSIIIPASVTSIGNDAFVETTALTTVTFEADSSITSIGGYVFYYSGLTTIYASQPLITLMEWSTSSTNTIGGKSGITVELLLPPPPPTPICFPAGTPVTTDQGLVAIEKLNTDKHTIRGKEIVAITQTRPLQKHIVCFEKDSLSKNVPSQETRCSMQHKVFYKREMMKARDIVKLCENVSLVPYNGETLYNVLLKKQGMMMINNLICETLDPKNIMAKISTMKDGQKKNKAICQLTKIIKENNVPEYQKLYASL